MDYFITRVKRTALKNGILKPFQILLKVSWSLIKWIFFCFSPEGKCYSHFLWGLRQHSWSVTYDKPFSKITWGASSNFKPGRSMSEGWAFIHFINYFRTEGTLFWTWIKSSSSPDGFCTLTFVCYYWSDTIELCGRLVLLTKMSKGCWRTHLSEWQAIWWPLRLLILWWTLIKAFIKTWSRPRSLILQLWLR